MIVGVDPGLKNVGVVVMEDDGHFVMATTLEMTVVEPVAWMNRLTDDLLSVISSYLSDRSASHLVACEGVYVGRNLRLAVKLAMIVGMVQAVAVFLGLRFVEIAPAAARKALTGDGSSGDMTALDCAAALTGRSDLSIHEADALGVALAARGLTGRGENGGS